MSKVTIYSTPTCPYCKMTKQYLARKNIVYTDIDVSASEQAAQQMIQKSGQQGVPVIDIDGKIIVGYQPAAIDSALEI